ncbi:NADH dehydrogenase [ubiquinone] 1 alpha subcomplex subunit 11 [Spodoptera litura]|uniref:NADH dehydrogenase [ubiquinone] 1 alpha subcomplex subunit 11 n=1 Tax=Spodoptera litura TaxID=69820 RepID=A0A9J7J2X3_SPOLT|nr:NADH dehydrogenase [ubiquinone] 1 alpha subcomplex subunit 11 [Spodoptera litura]
MSQLLKYEYYDTPEGQDIFMKTFAISKYAALAGTALASMDVLMYSHPKGFAATAGRFAWFLGPMVGMAAGFAVTANTVQNIRGKNDKLNYFLGGVVSGSIFTAWMRAGVIAVPAAVILGAAAVVKKTSIEEGWSFFPSVPHATQSARSVKYDWTMVKDIDELKNFTTGSN